MDAKAKQILFKYFWSASGWIPGDQRQVPAPDFEYAKSKGLMFDDVERSHQFLCENITKNFKEMKKSIIVKSFIASLTSRNLQYRSFLSSYSIASVLTHHKYSSKGDKFCNVCGVYGDEKKLYDLNVLNFEKIKWGGVRLHHLEYINFDLEQAIKVEHAEPSGVDYEKLSEIKATILSSSDSDRPRQLEKRLAKIIKSNAAEREVILNILGISGILETDEKRGFFQNFININEREARPVNKTDWSYPVDWWQGINGINEDAWSFYFE